MGNESTDVPRARELGLISSLTFPTKAERRSMRYARWRAKAFISALLTLGGKVIEVIAWLVTVAFRNRRLAAYIESLGVTGPPSLDGAIDEGVRQYERGEGREALNTFERLARTEEAAASPEVQTNLALLRAEMGDNEGALRAFRRSVEISYGLPDQALDGLSASERSILAAINRYELADRNQLLASTALSPGVLDAALVQLKNLEVVEEIRHPNGRRVYGLTLESGARQIR